MVPWEVKGLWGIGHRKEWVLRNNNGSIGWIGMDIGMRVIGTVKWQVRSEGGVESKARECNGNIGRGEGGCTCNVTIVETGVAVFFFLEQEGNWFHDGEVRVGDLNGWGQKERGGGPILVGKNEGVQIGIGIGCSQVG